MSAAQTLSALVNERLAAAAEEIFVLIERTILEYEEELSRSKQENQRKQQLLDQVLSSRVQLVRATVQIPPSPGPGLNQEITETPWIKEEPEVQSVRQEEEELPVPESSAVCVKTEESSLLQQRQTEHGEETQGEDISSEPHFHSDTEEHTEHSPDTDNDNDWEPSSPPAARSTDVQTQWSPELSLKQEIPETPETGAAVRDGHTAGTGAERREKHECAFCKKRFTAKGNLERHTRTHTGDRPYSCSTCHRAFRNSSDLRRHDRTHTGEKPFSCPICQRAFSHKSNCSAHMQIHTEERPYICSVCERGFTVKKALNVHMRTHTGDRPYSCWLCNRTFTNKQTLNGHMRTHTGERPFSCTVCQRAFAQRGNLTAHMKCHKTE